MPGDNREILQARRADRAFLFNKVRQSNADFGSRFLFGQGYSASEPRLLCYDCGVSSFIFLQHADQAGSRLKPSSLSFRALEFYGTRIRHRGQWRIHRSLRKLLRADIDCELQVERAGLKWNLNPSEFTQNNMFWLGEVDHWDYWHAKRLVKPGSVIFDVGANFGFYSLALASFLKRDCRVFAVEPHPVTRGRLLSNIAMNEMEEVITVIPCGFSERTESAYMAGYSPTHTGGAYCSSEPSGTPVTMTTLDEVAAQYQLSRLDFLKIDVEGYEERALRGGESTLRRFRPALLVESIDRQLRRADSSAESLAAYLRSLGYTLYVPYRKKLIPAVESPSGDSLNLLCLPVD